MQTRRVRSFLLPLALLAACSDGEGGLSKPTVDAGPVAALTLVFENPLDEPVYVDWPHTQPRFVIRRDTITLMTERGCIPFCGDGCSCSPCESTTSRVRRIPAKDSVTVTWKPEHYAVNACLGSASCSCVENWPLTAGHYELSLSAFTQASEGQASTQDPNLLTGAEPTNLSRPCEAVQTFELAGGATVTAQILCL